MAIDKDKILAGRKAVDAYRTAHAKLSANGWYKGISEDHTPLLNTLLTALAAQGFSSLREFFDTSVELNIQEFGFADRDDFEARAGDADREALEGMWK